MILRPGSGDPVHARSRRADRTGGAGGVLHQPRPILDRLNALVEALGDVTDPRCHWFISDNLLTCGRNKGFLSDQRFVSAMLAARVTPAEASLAWRTHTIRWAAQSCVRLEGDDVERGSCQGCTINFVMHDMRACPAGACGCTTCSIRPARRVRAR